MSSWPWPVAQFWSRFGEVVTLKNWDRQNNKQRNIVFCKMITVPANRSHIINNYSCIVYIRMKNTYTQSMKDIMIPICTLRHDAFPKQ